MSSNTRNKTESESVLSRWSRRKLESGNTPDAAGEALAENVSAVNSAPAADAPVDAQKPLTDADMPDIDSLETDADFSGFMSPGVSDELRNLALRKLFRAPVFNIRDGLDEYDEDYTSFEKLGDIVTADMKYQIELQQQRLREKLQRESQAIAEAELEDVDANDIEANADEDEADGEAPGEMNEQQQVAAVSVGETKTRVTGGHE